ncbi:MAG: CaiB/BaiF CoA transferase family protein, partial [Alphaproteobacteria bacterium]
MTDQVFKGLKVADFAWSGVGPIVSGYLAAHGATVIRIESSDRPDVMRFAGPFKNNEFNPNASLGFLQVHSGKKGIALDLKSEEGLKIAKQLIEWADVMTEAYVPGVMEKFGLGYDDAKKINPGIVYYGTSMMGRFGPLAGMPGFGTFLTPMTGLNDFIGWEDRGPVQIYGALTDVINFKYGIMAMNAALLHRKRTGEGQRIDLSQFAGGVTFCAEEILHYTANGESWPKTGNRDPQAAPHGVFPAAGDDRWIALCVWSDEDWKVLCSWMGDEALANDARFVTFEARKQNEDAL